MSDNYLDRLQQIRDKYGCGKSNSGVTTTNHPTSVNSSVSNLPPRNKLDVYDNHPRNFQHPRNNIDTRMVDTYSMKQSLPARENHHDLYKIKENPLAQLKRQEIINSKLQTGPNRHETLLNRHQHILNTRQTMLNKYDPTLINRHQHLLNKHQPLGHRNQLYGQNYHQTLGNKYETLVKQQPYNQELQNNPNRLDRIREIQKIRQTFAANRNKTIQDYAKENTYDGYKGKGSLKTDYDPVKLSVDRQRIMKEIKTNEHKRAQLFDQSNFKSRAYSLKKQNKSTKTFNLDAPVSFGLDAYHPKANQILHRENTTSLGAKHQSISPIKGLEHESRPNWNVTNMDRIQQRIQTILGKQ